MNRKIARFNERITIQKNEVTVDRYRNHITAWTDYYTCWAYAGTYQSDKEEPGNAVVKQTETIYFETRYCSELKDITSTEYRVAFNGDTYDILSVDMMNYQHQIIRIRCSLVQKTKEV